MTTPKELAAVQKAMTEAFALKALWAGKVQDAEDFRKATAVEVAESEKSLQAATVRADQNYKAAITKAQKSHAELQAKVTAHIDANNEATASALQALKEFQDKVREEYGAVIDLLGATGGGGGGRTRL